MFTVKVIGSKPTQWHIRHLSIPFTEFLNNLKSDAKVINHSTKDYHKIVYLFNYYLTFL